MNTQQYYITLTAAQIEAELKTLLKNYINSGFKPIARYDYFNVDGRLEYFKVRLERAISNEKKILPVSWNGTALVLKEPVFPGKKPLYNLPALGNANPIIYVEGEKCADALNNLGLVATTSGSSNSHAKTDFEPLRGKEVLIWPDNDEPGLKHGNSVFAILKNFDCDVRLIDAIQLHLPPTGDAIDWLHINNPNEFKKAHHE